MRYIVVIGGFADGFTYTGTFDGLDAAFRWANRNMNLENYDIVPLHSTGDHGNWIIVSGSPIFGWIVTGTFASEALAKACCDVRSFVTQLDRIGIENL